MFERQIEIPSAEEIRYKTPLPPALAAVKARRDDLVKDVIAGRSDKLLVIVGPCSAHECAPVLEYIRRLGRLSERVEDKLVLVPRIYTNKPRSKGVGYKGMFSQPDPENRENILKGIFAIRDLHIRAIEESGLSAADEMLYPENYAYVEDLLTYIAVGARSSENQLHRLVSSGIPFLGSAISALIDSSIQGLTNGTMTAVIGFQTIRYLNREYRLQSILDGVEVAETQEELAQACAEIKDELKRKPVRARQGA